jgi:ABC-2 type transport system permease protein
MSLSADMSFSRWIAFFTLLKREVMRYMKLAVQTVVGPFLSNLFFLAVFGGLLSARSSGLEGVPYVRLLVPGLIFMGAFLSSFQNPVFSLISMKYQNTLQDLCQYPLSAVSRFLAFSFAGALRGLLVGGMTYAAAGLFAGYAIHNPLLFWAYIASVSFIGATGGIAAGLYLDSFEKANFIVGLVLTPALYLSGVFYYPGGATSWLGILARYNPLTFLVGAGRNLFLGVGALGGPVTILLAGVFCAALVALSAAAIVSGKGMKIE